MNKYKCIHFIGQYEEDDIKKINPILEFCNHWNNKISTEGNCNKDLCPLNRSMKRYMFK